MRERVRRPGAAAGEAAGRGTLAAPRSVGRATGDHPPPFAVRPHELEAALGPGEPLPADAGDALRQVLGHDFSRVRVHADARDDHVARALGADALAFGGRMVFRQGRYAPGTPGGDALLAHEAWHLAAGAEPGGTRGATPVQLAVGVDDVAQEMVGMPFVLRSQQGTAPNLAPAGATVTVTAWPTGPTADVSYTSGAGTVTLTVPKLQLNPAYTAVAGVRRYTVGLSAQQTAVQSREAKVGAASASVSDWSSKQGEYKQNPQVWQEGADRLLDELLNQQTLLEGSQAELSRMLVRETMYNRFDGLIAQWVGYYNQQFNPAVRLDPNVVKSLIFEESRMGTHGEHLELPPYSYSDEQKYPVRSRYNVGQAVDSYAHEQMLMIEEMAPDIYASYHLDALKQAEHDKVMTESDLFTWNGGTLQFAIHDFFSRRDLSGKNLMGTQGRDLYEDYGFWIRTSIRWLFYKYMSLDTPSWSEAVRAYNGDGPRARAYRDRVLARSGSQSALKVGNQ